MIITGELAENLCKILGSIEIFNCFIILGGRYNMKPIELAKEIWDYAVELEPAEGKIPGHAAAPLRGYPGILSIFAGIQAAAESGNREWIDEVKGYLAKYPHRFNEPDVFFKGSFDNYRLGGLGKGWAVMAVYLPLMLS